MLLEYGLRPNEWQIAFDDDRIISLREIGKGFSLSPEKTRSIINNALNKLDNIGKESI